MKTYHALSMNEQIDLQREVERLRDELSIMDQDAIGEIIESPDRDGCYVEIKENISYYLGQKVYLHPAPPLNVDWLSNAIRKVDGNHDLSAGTLAEKIMDEIIKAAEKS